MPTRAGNAGPASRQIDVNRLNGHRCWTIRHGVGPCRSISVSNSVGLSASQSWCLAWYASPLADFVPRPSFLLLGINSIGFEKLYFLLGGRCYPHGFFDLVREEQHDRCVCDEPKSDQAAGPWGQGFIRALEGQNSRRQRREGLAHLHRDMAGHRCSPRASVTCSSFENLQLPTFNGTRTRELRFAWRQNTPL